MIIICMVTSHEVIVNLTSGLIRGEIIEINGQKVQAFKSVPFAQPPIGDLRFAVPQPHENWYDIKNTTRYSSACMSNTSQTTSPQKNISEDCLYTNIWADLRCLNKKCPVVYYIHGGGFFYDSAIMFNETEIMLKFGSQKLVFVVSAFRLGIFGALDLGEELEEAPYNVNLLVYIGSGLASLQPHTNLKLTNAIATKVGCKNATTYKQRLKCLQNVHAEKLNNAARETELIDWRAVGPQSDVHTLPGGSFMDLIGNWKAVPLLISTTVHEMTWSYHTAEYLCSMYIKMFGYRSDAVREACTQRYKSNIALLSPEAMHAMAYFLAKLNALRTAPTYFLVWAQKDHDKHSDEMSYFFGLHYIHNKTQDDVKADHYYPFLCRNFFYGRKPLDDWEPLDYNGRNYYYFNFSDTTKPHMVKRGVFDTKSIQFWLYHLKEIEQNSTLNFIKKEQIGNKSYRKLKNTDTIERMKIPKAGIYKRMVNDYDYSKVEQSTTIPLLTVLTVLIIAAFVLATVAFSLSVLQMCIGWGRKVKPRVEEEEMKVLRRYSDEYPRYVF
ncbi:unnamed protein product [Bursaphelenchus okinawaensis]|uniref:Carboxylesterase type B domain-containing protein n=1 Tax=Bursaphelenchus okinawaensis TaxID=465554 RepID=A0A811LX46_9BILA|nr:unnamed protein product [Bursaphelenchus okinawaensis]CAG9128675.1 unnamed protein product [Bursaphelenchus okinawaensis]